MHPLRRPLGVESFALLGASVLSACPGSITGGESLFRDVGTPSFEVGAPDDLGFQSVDDSGADPVDGSSMDALEDPDAGDVGATDGGQTTATFRLVNVGTNARDSRPGYANLPATLSRVEMPPSITFEADIMPAPSTVRLLIDGGSMYLDTSPPFRLNEGSDGRATAWTPTPGMHRLEARAYSTSDGSGAPTAVFRFDFNWSEAGTESGFTPQSTEAWVRQCVEIDGSREVSAACGGLNGNHPVAGNEPFAYQSFQGTVDSINYRVFVPRGYDSSLQYPLVVYLHGFQTQFFRDPVGGGPENERRTRVAVAVSPLFNGPRSLISPNFRNDFPAMVIVPQCICECDQRRLGSCPGVNARPQDGWPVHEWAEWEVTDAQGNPLPEEGLENPERGAFRRRATPSRAGGTVLELVEALGRDQISVGNLTLNVDPDRVYIAGESMGALGTWDLVARRPDLFAAAVPMAGFTDDSAAPRLNQLSIWSFHHQQDFVNPIEGNCRMMRLLGGAIAPAGSGVCAAVSPVTRDDARMTRYTFGVGGPIEAHLQTFERAWREIQLYDWLFSQTR